MDGALFDGGADESIEVMNGKVNFEGISGDSSSGFSKILVYIYIYIYIKS